jgi:hypothetical protein
MSDYLLSPWVLVPSCIVEYLFVGTVLAGLVLRWLPPSFEEGERRLVGILIITQWLVLVPLVLVPVLVGVLVWWCYRAAVWLSVVGRRQ